MPKVFNPREEGVNILRWRLLPKSRIFIDPSGRLVEDVPSYVAYSPQAKALADQGLLRIEGYTPAGSLPQPSTESRSSSGTVLANRRDMRARKLKR